MWKIFKAILCIILSTLLFLCFLIIVTHNSEATDENLSAKLESSELEVRSTNNGNNSSIIDNIEKSSPRSKSNSNRNHAVEEEEEDDDKLTTMENFTPDYIFREEDETTLQTKVTVQIGEEDPEGKFEYSSVVQNPRRPIEWIFYAKKDCYGEDVGNCKGIQECKKQCEKDPNCEGFNSFGYLKKAGCENRLSDHKEIDVHILKNRTVESHVAKMDKDPKFHFQKFKGLDCRGTDIDGFLCPGKPDAYCQKLCLSIPQCVGYNSRGYLKQAGCMKRMYVNPSINIFLVRNRPPFKAYQPWKESPPIWPHPKHFNHGKTSLLVHKSVHFEMEPVVAANADVKAAIKRFKSLVFVRESVKSFKAIHDKLMLRKNKVSGAVGGGAIAEHAAHSSRDTFEALERLPRGMIIAINVEIGYVDAPLNLEMNEEYSLHISLPEKPNGATKILIRAPSKYGFYHALQTLSQIIRFDFELDAYLLYNAPWEINDAPRFPHRELLIDTSRHFLPIPLILRTIDGLTYTKMNVLHWHISDHQSFPLVIPSRPLLASEGAFSPMEKYTLSEMAQVVEYARQRGVRVVAEIDVPGHAAAICRGYPEVCPTQLCQTPLSPHINETYELIEDVIRDVVQYGGLIDPFFHVGGDEAIATCWRETPEIDQWMRERKWGTGETMRYFLLRVHSILEKYNKTAIGWEETFFNCRDQLHNDTIIQVWLDANTAKRIITAQRVIFDPYPIWYLDYTDVVWERSYVLEPCQGIDEEGCNRILGGGGMMWGEKIDISNFESTVWPRLASIAERLWSPKDIVDIEKARHRLVSFRCLMNFRGSASATSTNPLASQAPPTNAGCYSLL